MLDAEQRALPYAFRLGAVHYEAGNGAAHQNIAANNFGLAGGKINSDNAVQIKNWNDNGSQALRALTLLASDDFSSTYTGRVPATGIYSKGGVAIGTSDGLTAGYLLDVNSAARFRTSIAVGSHINLTPVRTPAASAATGVLYVDLDNKLYYIKPNGTPIYIAG